MDDRAWQLIRILASETPDSARDETISELSEKATSEEIIGVLDSSDSWPLRCGAATYLGATRTADAVAALVRALGDDTRRVRVASRDALEAIGEPAIGALEKAHDQGPPRIQREAASALRGIQRRE